MWPFDWHQTIYGIIFAVAVFMAFLGDPNPDEAYGHEMHSHGKAEMHYAVGSVKPQVHPRWRNKPFIYKVKYLNVPFSKLRETCQQLAWDYNFGWKVPARVAECAFIPGTGDCIVVLPEKDTAYFTRADAKEHGDAHCKGWRHR